MTRIQSQHRKWTLVEDSSMRTYLIVVLYAHAQSVEQNGAHNGSLELAAVDTMPCDVTQPGKTTWMTKFIDETSDFRGWITGSWMYCYFRMDIHQTLLSISIYHNSRGLQPSLVDFESDECVQINPILIFKENTILLWPMFMSKSLLTASLSRFF